MRAVIWLDEALEDLKIIGAFIRKDSTTKAAYEVLSRIKAAADSLSYYPEIGRPGRIPGTRELVVNELPYILPYQVTGKNIRILAVMHTSRKWPDTFKKIRNE